MQIQNVHMMHMSPFGDVTFIMQMSHCRDVMMPMPPCRDAMMQMFWRKHKLFKNSIYFQIEASLVLEPKIFSKLDLLFLKKSYSFRLKAFKKIWWSLLENLRMGHWLGIWWSGLKDLFSQFGWAKKGTFPRPFFGKTNSLKIKHLKKIHFF